LSDRSIHILSSRRNDYVKTVDIINIDDLFKQFVTKDENNQKIYRGGVSDEGTYDEGECIRLNGQNSLGKFTYILCSDKDDEATKNMWLSFLSDLKLHEQGDISSPNFLKGLTSQGGM
jgi:hypothetical protein